MTEEIEYYSQHGEDYLLHWLFANVESGFYVDIGAFDGRHLSNTYIFEQRGWSGICVEAHPDYFPALERNRPNATCVHAAVVPTTEPFVAFQKEPLGLLSGAAPDRTRGLEARYAARNMTFEGFETIEVPALTPDALMEQHARGRRRFEILSIDTEGTDLEVLRAFDLQRYLPAAIVIEANEEADERSVASLMSSRSYHFARRVGCNLIFCRQRDHAVFVQHKRISCRIADTLHPLGEEATPGMFRARVIEERADEQQQPAPNVLQQLPGQPLSTLLDWFPDPSESRGQASHKLAHVVHMSSARIDEQQVTARSLAAAAQLYGGEVRLLNVQQSSDPDLTPGGFVRTTDLTRDVRDLREHSSSRNLALLFDILDRAVDGVAPDDHVIFSNGDICAHEHFYSSIDELLACGFDAITVNRRTIGRIDSFPTDSVLPLAETGLLHPGFDCFVFRREMYDRFVKNLACVGTALVGRALLYNMIAHAERMLMLKDVSLTYHYGNDQPWDRDEAAAETEHNFAETRSLLIELCKGPQARERLAAFCENHREPSIAPRHLQGTA